MYYVIGTTTLDSIVRAPDRGPQADGDEFTSDSLVFCDLPSTLLMGGNGGNTAYALGILEAPTSLYSAVGRDLPGDLLFHWLVDAGVETAGIVRHDRKSTSSTTVILDGRQNRRTFHHHGASAAIGPTNFSTDPLGKGDVLLITGYPLLTGWRTPGTVSVLRLARRAGTTTALDIGPAIGSPVRLEELRPALPHLDYLLGNEHELSELAGGPDVRIERTAAELLDTGLRNLIVKQGPRGASYAVDASSGLEHVCGFAVEAEHTVGAGDSFNAGFLYAQRHDYSLRNSIRFGNALAAQVVASGRGVIGCPTHSDLRDFISRRVSGP